MSTGIQLRSVAPGAAPTASTEVFNAPFPQSHTVSTGATFLTKMVNSLANNTQVQLNGGLGALLDRLVNGTILPTLTPIVTGAETPVLAPALGGVVDPLLRSLGTGLGQHDLTVDAVSRVAATAANADFATTAEGQPVPVAVLPTTRPSRPTRSASPASRRRPTGPPSSTPTGPSSTPRRRATSAAIPSPTRSPTPTA